MCGVEPCEVPVAAGLLLRETLHRAAVEPFGGAGRSLIGIGQGLRIVVVVVLRENAETDLVEWRVPQGTERLPLQLLRLMDPGVAGRPEGQIRRAVGIGKMSCSAHTHGAVVVPGGGCHETGAFQRQEIGEDGAALETEMQTTFLFGHIADDKGVAAVIEALRCAGHTAFREETGEPAVRERVAGRHRMDAISRTPQRSTVTG